MKRFVPLFPFIIFFISGIAYCQDVKSSQGAPETDAELAGHGPDKMVFIAGIIRIYNESLKREQDNVPLRKRYIEFLLRYSQEKKALGQMRILIARTPHDVDLSKRIETLATRLAQGS